MRWRRRLLLASLFVGVVLLGLGIAFGVTMYVTFDGVAPVEDGQQVGPATVVLDGYVSCDLVELGDGHVALIDACGSADPILAALSRAGHTPADVVAILLTHGHDDHRGGVASFPNAEIYAHEDELPLLRGEVAARGPLPQLAGRATPLEVDHALTDRERFEVGGLAVQVFHVPGHTDGSVAYLIGETLFLGDNAHSMVDGTVSLAPWVFSDDVAANCRSLGDLVEKLDEEGAVVSTLVFAHARPVESMDPLTELARTCLSR